MTTQQNKEIQYRCGEMYSQRLQIYNRKRQQDHAENSIEFINTDSED
jgi:hypothetical protein